MHPYAFPEPFPIVLGCEDYRITVMVKRVPNNSVSVAAFESDKNEGIYIKYYVDLARKTIIFNMTINFAWTNTIKDIVASISIYNAFIEGKGIFNELPFNIHLETDKAKKIDQRTFCFWEKVLRIEDTLGVAFIPSHENLDLDLIYLVEELFQNLINHKPIRDTNKIDSIETKWDFNNTSKNFDNLIGKPIVLKFEATKNFELFGVKLQLHALVGVFNSVINEYSITKGGEYKLILVDESEDRKRYASIICFATKAEMDVYKGHETQKVLDFLREAKTTQEYLQKF